MDYLAPIDGRFDNVKVVAYAQDLWYYSLYISGAYVVSVFCLRRYMEQRQRFTLRVPLFMWSLTLALFSVMGSLALAGRMLRHLLDHGWESSVCSDIITTGQSGLWAFLFCFSKLLELVDTYFVVLRKQKLIFLHWYHHVTVFIYCWYHYAVQVRPAQWFITLNFVVHAVMYSYYALRASGHVRPPIWVNMFITFLQLLQMVFGVSINMFVYTKMSSDSSWRCDGIIETSYFYVYWSFAMYFSYFLLFAHFFWSVYFCKQKSVPSSSNGVKGSKSVGTTALHSNGMTSHHISKYSS